MTPQEYFFYFQQPDLVIMDYFAHKYVWDSVYESLRDPMSYDKREYLFYLKKNFYVFKSSAFLAEIYEHTVVIKADMANVIDPYNLKYKGVYYPWARPYSMPRCTHEALVDLLSRAGCPPKGLVDFANSLNETIDNFWWQHSGKSWFYPNLDELPNQPWTSTSNTSEWY